MPSRRDGTISVPRASLLVLFYIFLFTPFEALSRVPMKDAVKIITKFMLVIGIASLLFPAPARSTDRGPRQLPHTLAVWPNDCHARDQSGACQPPLQLRADLTTHGALCIMHCTMYWGPRRQRQIHPHLYVKFRYFFALLPSSRRWRNSRVDQPRRSCVQDRSFEGKATGKQTSNHPREYRSSLRQT
jgi:hypothetical protein